MTATIVSSTSNPLAKRIRRLRQKKYRQQEGAFFIEGVRIVAAAIEAHAAVEQLIWCDALLTSDFGRNLLATSPLPRTEVSAAVFNSFTQRDNPVGLAAILKTQLPALSEYIPSGMEPLVALHEIADPGNLGTILRSADATAAQAVILVGNTVDPFHPTVTKASMGARFSTKLLHCPDIETCLAWCRKHSCTIIATSAKADLPYSELTNCALGSHPLLLMGSEQKGLSAETLDSADIQTTIPMHGTSTSLNLAIATSLLLYEFCRPAATTQ